MLKPLAPVVALLALFLPGGCVCSAENDQTARDERLLRDGGVRTDGPGLLAFFRQHISTESDLARIDQLIKDLGDDKYRIRQQASARLAGIGERAAPRLKLATERSRDPEVIYRAECCLRAIKTGSAEAILAAAARLVALRKPEGAAEVLIEYVPFAEQGYLDREVHTALAAVAVRGGKPVRAVVEALTDKLPARRLAAGIALVRAGDAGTLPAVRKLLRDPKPEVRLGVALALAAGRDKDALPVLIALFEDLPLEDLGEVEELLYTLAGDKAPDVLAGTTPEQRRKYRTAWDNWFRASKDAIDPARLEEALRPRDRTLVILLNDNCIIDVDAANKVRFRIEGLKFPLDAQYLPGDKVLVAEHGGNLVTERNSKGEVVWKKEITQPLMAQRLPGGNTFIATASQFVEVDRKGQEVWKLDAPLGGRVMKAVRLRNGNVACVALIGATRFYEVDREGKQVRSFPVQLSTSGGRIEVLNNGHVVMPEKEINRVVEHDAQGKRIWEAPFAEPIAAIRLPNGNTLVTSYQAPRAVEIDRKGREVWEYKGDSRVTRAWRH